MAYFYVKSGGTATGDAGRYASQQTGSFASIGASGYYDNINAAFGATTAPTNGDFICVSASHSHNYTGSTTFNAPSVSVGSGLTVMSVSDTNCDAYARGAAETTSNLATIGFDGYVKVLGFDFTPGDDFILAGEQDQTYYDCSITVSASTDRPLRVAGDLPARFINCTFNFNDATADPMFFTASCDVRFINCTFATSASYADYVMSLNTTDNQNIEFIGCDFSGLSSSYILDGGNWDAQNNYPARIKMVNCKIPSLTDWVFDLPANFGHEFIATGTSSSSGPQEYQYTYLTGVGRVEEDTAIYRTASTAFPSGQKISLKVTTVANTSEARPFSFDFPTRYAALSSTSTDNITIYILSATALDDSDVFCSIIYPDGTNEHTPNSFLSVTDAFDPFRSAGSLTTNTETWNGYTSQNRYQIDLDTSADAGADSLPFIRFYITRASTTIYFCPTIGLS